MMLKRVVFMILNLLMLANIAYAGDRELVKVSNLPGLENVIIYTKVHMDSIQLYTLPDGSRGFFFLQEGHTTNTVNPELHTMSLDKVEVNIDKLLYKVTATKIVDYTNKKVTYTNASLGWLKLSEEVSPVWYIIDNYERYITRGTIGDTFRPNDNAINLDLY